MVRPVAVVVALLVLAGTSAGAPAALPDPGAPDTGPASTDALVGSPVADGERPLASVPAQLAPPNTTAVLLLDQERGAIHEPEPALSTALSTNHAVTDERIAREALRERYANASDDERAAVLHAALDRLEARAATANAEVRRAQQGYANGTLSRATTVQRVANLHDRARAFGATLAVVEARADDVSGSEVASRAESVERSLVALRGPVRGQLSDAIAGGNNVSRVYVAGTDSGLRFGSVADGVHYHETAREVPADAAPRESTTIEDARQRLADLYPWAWNASSGTTVDVVGADTYRATIEHPHGSLVSYLDGETLSVVREVQRQRVADLPNGPSVATTRGDLRVTVNRTYPGGPLRVAVNESGSAADATVRVDDVVVGRTGDDGTLWTVSPDGGTDNRFIVTAEQGENQVSLIVQPLQPSSGA